MGYGIAHYGLAVMGMLVIWLWIRLLCRYNYERGRVEGMRDEALAWCEAMDNMMLPNWQSLPIDPREDKEPQVAFNKLYVKAFEAALVSIGLEVAASRLEALKGELTRLGFVRKTETDENK